ncbi:RNA polymerase recycling motor ATPase HelR [Microbacterium candidum]|uniref:RNA polymerase recycling motor ATPase HelR n=1 Tax=Microbacterium candidum TaxID=3041922 RepID=A0ABT7N227_9MICO|nr:RNA polymerase recycling motor ATPase HelR [Microbacterium sp. ASV49]MDL9980766.1 RNA polymerase recycling motor ATPase HelR [Microbacterium sp. ASV49]
MTTVTAFDLPERLHAKAAPALIAHDEDHFARIAATLDEQISALSERLDAERLAPGGGGQAALERDLEIHRLTAALRMLRRFGLDLCLGRIVAEGADEPTYIGRLGLTDATGRRLLVDWRTPAAEPFFAATHGDPEGLVSRRRYRWSHGRIVDYWDEVFAPDPWTSDTWRAERAALDDQSAFIASLGTSRTAHMRDVLGTIQADQDAVIRASSRGPLVVDGGPGTGKTVVALHRAAYLLYSDPHLGDRRRGGVLFVGPHNAYVAYVADVLPSLGEDGVQTCTLRDLVAEGATAVPEADRSVARLKGGADMVRAVERAAELLEQPPAYDMIIQTEWADIRISSADWAAAFAAVEPGLTHNEAREQVWETILQIIASRAASLGLEARPLHRALARDEAMRKALDRAWPRAEGADLVARLLTDAGHLTECAPWLSAEEVALLQRADGHAWTVADLPLLDAARQRIGAPDAAEIERGRDATLAAEREYMADVVDSLVASDVDGESVLSWMMRGTNSGEDVTESLVDEAVLEARDLDLLAGPFGHVIVDEAQELTDAEWLMLLRRCPSRSLTIVGDRAQARHGFPQTWEERLARVDLDRARVASLRVNYRTPSEVMDEAAPVIRSVVPDANVPTSVRSTGVPVRYGIFSEADAILADWISTHDEGVACVIGDPSRPDTARIRSLSPENAKGLEFDLVVLVDGEAFPPGLEGTVDRYVAMTRATQELVVLS